MKSIQEIFPRASKSFIEANHGVLTHLGEENDSTGNLRAKNGIYEAINHRKLQDSESEHHKTPALGATVQGKTQGVERTRVCFIGYRCKPLDPDNFAGSVKDLLDGLRHSGLIHGDEVWRIALETRQEKVSHYTQEKTVIEIEK